MPEQKIRLEVSEDDQDVAYLVLPAHPGRGTPGCVSETKSLAEVIDGYKGPAIYLDFDKEGSLIGIEILA